MSRPPASLAAERTELPIIVHSHLRWDFVWQRPQQILSRLSQRGHVLFVEEPIYLDDIAAPRLDVSLPFPKVHRALPALPASLRGSYDQSITVVRELVRGQVGDGGALAGLFERPLQWFYTPMPAPAMIGAFGERGIVYDCMDELSKFRFAPAELTDRERYLMANADVVFTGGHRLWVAKSKHHRNVHFFGCGVDVDHFASARSDDLPLAPELAGQRKTLGYFGVVDERIDYDLIRRLAASFPEATIAIVGPVVKVDPAELPQASNIRWLGQRQYTELPSYVKGFDVCLMPFALNEATEYINPTKTLEYMAAGKPIVSTAVSDVVHNFTPVVAVAQSHDEFVALCRAAIEAPDLELIARGIEQARANSWESIVSRMDRIVRDSFREEAAHHQVAPGRVERESSRAERPHLRRSLARAEEVGD